jgi:hypothetical protein
LNLHEVNPHQALNLARLPIPPLRLELTFLLYARGAAKSSLRRGRRTLERLRLVRYNERLSGGTIPS